MTLNEVDIIVLDAIASEPNGISFNSLVRKLRGRVSRVTVLKALKKLVKLGVVDKYRDDRHKQKVIYKVINRIRNVYQQLSISVRDHRDIISYMKELISRYENIILNNADDFTKKYATHKILISFKEALEVGLHGKNTFDGG